MQLRQSVDTLNIEPTTPSPRIRMMTQPRIFNSIGKKSSIAKKEKNFLDSSIRTKPIGIIRLHRNSSSPNKLAMKETQRNIDFSHKEDLEVFKVKILLEFFNSGF